MDGASFWPSTGYDGFLICLFLIAVLNTLGILCAVVMTIYASTKQLATRGLIIYWFVTLLVLFISLCLKTENGLFLYAFASPALLLLLRFQKRFNS